PPFNQLGRSDERSTGQCGARDSRKRTRWDARRLATTAGGARISQRIPNQRQRPACRLLLDEGVSPAERTSAWLGPNSIRYIPSPQAHPPHGGPETKSA